MSNLGFYQTLTTLSKKVGDPKRLVGIIAVGGYVTLRLGEAGVKKGAKIITNKFLKKDKLCINKGIVYDVIADEQDSGDLFFRIGDKYKVLNCDGDSILIEKLGDDNNPYYVSRDFLVSISDYQ